MSRPALAVRHVPFEDLGILAPVLEDRGYAIRYVEAGIDHVGDDSVREADLLIVLGGPIGVGDIRRYPFLDDELKAVGARIEHGLPTLGICLGAQLIAKALGADVRPTGRVEIGFAPLTLTPDGQRGVLGQLGQTPVLHWHGDEFQIPAGAARLAETPLRPTASTLTPFARTPSVTDRDLIIWVVPFSVAGSTSSSQPSADSPTPGGPTLHL